MKTADYKPLLPLRDIIIFPSMVVPLFVGREKSIRALNEVMKSDKSIILVAQKNSETDDPQDKDLFAYGCQSKILQLLKLPDGTVKVLVEGQKRVKILNVKDDKEKNFLLSEVELSEDINYTNDLELFAESLAKKFEKLLILNKKDTTDYSNNIKDIKGAGAISNNIAANLNLSLMEKQEILETKDVRKRLEKINKR